MRRLILLCLAALSMTAAVAWASPFTGRPVETRSGAAPRIAGSKSVLHRGKHKKRRPRPADDTVLFGDKAVESRLADEVRGRPEAFPFKNRSTGSAFTIAVYLPAQNKAKTLVTGLYAARHKRPGPLVAVGSLRSLRAGAWNSVKIPATRVKPGTYWVAILGEGGTLYFRARSHSSCSGKNTRRGAVAGLPSSWEAGPTTNTCPISAHVDGRRRLGSPVGRGSNSGPPIVAGTLSLASPASGGSSSSTAPTDSPLVVAPPVNTGAPTVSGSAVAGDTLTVSNGSWIGSPTSYAYQWQDCSTLGLVCTDINDATSNIYTLGVSDVGDTVRVVVTAGNNGGSGSSISAQTGVVAPLPPPANTGPPTLTGPAVQGQTLTTSNGSWSGSPTGYSYQWEDCNSSGGSCTGISNATASSYTLASGDVGHTIRSVVTAGNGGGSNPASSAQTAVVTVPAPTNTTAPTLSGSAVQGQTLTTSNGSWSGSPTGYSYQWEDCSSAGGSCATISSATASSYTLGTGDVGHTIRSVVTATNSGGSAPASSAASSVVSTAGSAPSNTGAPVISGQTVQGDLLSASNGSWGNGPTSYGYQWEDCDSTGGSCANISGATASTYTLASGDVNDTIRVVVTASNASGSGQGTSAAVGPVTSSGGSGGGLPSGVSLEQIDGGANYYCSNGFTDACSAGWDSPSFFPVVDDYAFYQGNSTSTFKALGLTSSVRVTGGTDMSYLRSAGITAIPADDSATDFGSESVGGHIEEPTAWSDITSQASALNSLFGLSGRFLQGSFTWNQLYYGNVSGSACGGSGTMTMQEIFSCTSGMPNGQHLNIATDDLYWFAGSGNSSAEYEGGMVEQNGGTATADQMARGSNYGDMVDIMRGWLTSPAQDAPIAPYIETEDGLLTGSGVREITPPELNWAVWSSILHGARLLVYFGTTSNYGSGSTFGFSQNVLPGQSISMYAQGADTNKLVENLAPIINSPFALNYASVTPAGYTFPTEDLGWKSTPGIDVSTKYYTGGSFTNSNGTFGNGFYIIASPRASESATNIAATFTIPGNYSGPVNVIDASTGAPTTSTLTVSNHKITDTFAHAYDTQIIGPIPNQ